MSIPYRGDEQYGENDSEYEDSFSDSEITASSDELDPSWQDEVSKDGELFYVEEEDGDEKSEPARSGVSERPNTSEQQHLHGTSQEPRQNRALNPNIPPHSFETIEKQGTKEHFSPKNPIHEAPNNHLRKKSNSSLKNEMNDSRQRIPEKEDDEKKQTDSDFKLHSEEVELKNVFISVNAASSYGRKSFSTLLESMLGIISYNNENGGQYLHNRLVRSTVPDELIVSAMLPSRAAFMTEEIYVGDVLLAVNDVAVYQSNIEQVLGRVPEKMQLKLTFQCRKQHSDPEPYNKYSLEEVESDSRYRLKASQYLNHSSMNELVTSIGYYHAVFYLTLNVNSETAKGEEDVLYSYPTSENPSSRKLKSVRGIFTTLADVSKDAFKSKVLSSTLRVDEELVHCAYYHQGSEVMVICIPASKCPLAHLHKMMENTIRLLGIMFQSLSLAFHPENWSRLDHVFYLLFTGNTWSGIDPEGLICPPVFGTRVLTLDEELYLDVDAALSELEAADFDDGVNIPNLTRRMYTILGCCFFYKGYLIANHLQDEDLKDISLYCQSYCLLGKLRVRQLLIWRQMFPWRRKNKTKKQSGGFQETKGKYYLLIVGLRYSLLCMLLEAGGCTVPATTKPGPDAMYVNRTRATILQMESMDVPSCIEEHLCRPTVPALSSADSLTKKPASSLFSSTVHNKPPSGSGQLKQDATGSQGTIKLPFQSTSKKSTKSSSEGSGVPSVSNPPHTPDKTTASPRFMKRIGSQKSLASQGSVDSVGSKGMKSIASAFSLGDLRSALPSTVKNEMKRLTVGTENTLFHFMHLDISSGIIMTPSDQNVACLDGQFHRNVVENFRQCALVLHERLAQSQFKSAKQTRYEEGILFHCQMTNVLSEGNKKPTPFLQYWVVGRSIPQHKPCEFYVCFHDSAQQDMLELAFRMGFGHNIL